MHASKRYHIIFIYITMIIMPIVTDGELVICHN